MDMRDRIREKLQDKIRDWQEPSAKRIFFTLDKKEVFEAAKILFRQLELRFITASAIDLAEGLGIIYHFSNDPAGEIYSVRVILEDKLKPEVRSITPLFAGAEWIEREIWEMFGINFIGHPNLKKLLLSDDWPEGNYPLRNNK